MFVVHLIEWCRRSGSVCLICVVQPIKKSKPICFRTHVIKVTGYNFQEARQHEHGLKYCRRDGMAVNLLHV